MNRIVVVEDERVFRELLCEYLVRVAKLTVVGEFGDGRQALNFCETNAVDAVILDLVIPRLNGRDLIRNLQKVAPGVRLCVLSGNLTRETVMEIYDMGVHGMVEKGSPLTTLAEAIQQVLHGRLAFHVSVFPDGQFAFQSDLQFEEKLTSREREVLQLVAEGLTSKGIASQLGISARTVQKHRENLMRKLDLHDSAALTRYAIKSGLADDSVPRPEGLVPDTCPPFRVKRKTTSSL